MKYLRKLIEQADEYVDPKLYPTRKAYDMEMTRRQKLGKDASTTILNMIRSGALNDEMTDMRRARTKMLMEDLLDLDRTELNKRIQKEILLGTLTLGQAKLAKEAWRDGQEAIRTGEGFVRRAKPIAPAQDDEPEREAGESTTES